MRRKNIKYIMSYADNILAISLDATSVLEDLQKDGGITYKMGEIKPPEMCLGAHLQERVVARTNQKCWTITSNDYIKAAINTIRKPIKGNYGRSRVQMYQHRCHCPTAQNWIVHLN